MLCYITQLYNKYVNTKKMGNICAGKHQKQQTAQTMDNMNRNFTMYSFLIKELAVVDLIIGTYHFQKSQTLLAIVQKQYLDYCAEMRDYADDVEQTMASIMSQSKNTHSIAVNKECPYKKLQVCLLSAYSSQQSESQQYLKTFASSSKQILSASEDITIQLTHTSQSSNGLPNQTLMAIFMKSLSQRIDALKQSAKLQSATDETSCKARQQSNSRSNTAPNSTGNSTGHTQNGTNKPKLRISVIGSDSKIINLVRFEVIKLEDFKIRKL